MNPGKAAGRPVASINRLMVVVVLVALDCFLIRYFVDHQQHPVGDLATGLILSAGSIALLYSRGSGRTFVIGFVAWALVASVVLVILRARPAGSALIDASIDHAFRILPRKLTNGQQFKILFLDGSVVFTQTIRTLRGRLIAEAVIGLAIFLVGLFGGLLALVCRRRGRSNPSPDPALS